MNIKLSPKFQTFTLFEIDLLLGFYFRIFSITGRIFHFYDEIYTVNTTSLFYLNITKTSKGLRLDYWDLFFWRGIKTIFVEYILERNYHNRYENRMEI